MVDLHCAVICYLLTVSLVQVIRWLGPHRSDRREVRFPKLGSKKVVPGNASSSNDGQPTGTARLAAQLVARGQVELLQELCSTKGQKVCSIQVIGWL